MIPKEKALEIFNKMCNSVDELLPLDVKQCALIAVDEIIKDRERLKDAFFYDLNYWIQVRNEINNL